MRWNRCLEELTQHKEASCGHCITGDFPPALVQLSTHLAKLLPRAQRDETTRPRSSASAAESRTELSNSGGIRMAGHVRRAVEMHHSTRRSPVHGAGVRARGRTDSTAGVATHLKNTAGRTAVDASSRLQERRALQVEGNCYPQLGALS